MLQAKTKYHYLPNYLALVKKTLVSFDDANRAANPPPPKRVVKRVAKKRSRR
jgi:hypothetical protein